MAAARSIGNLAVLAERVRPLSLAGEHLLPVHPVLAGLLPHGGLQRGSAVAVQGPGATSLALALVGAATGASTPAAPGSSGQGATARDVTRGASWLAAVGVRGLGLGAAESLGVALERLVVVDPVPPERWLATVGSLADAFDLVLVGAPAAGRVRPGDARRLGGRLRERGSVLVRVGWPGEVWPEGADLELTVRPVGPAGGWEGIGGGHGYLRARRVAVQVRGRRGADRPRHGELWLPDGDGRLAAVATPAAALVSTAAPDQPVSGSGRLSLVPRAG